MKRNLKNFVEAGYKKKASAKKIDNYVLDEDLSTKRDKVYYDPNTGKAVHTIAGTDSLKDWANNVLIPLELHQYSNRHKNAEKIHKKANEKYGKSNVDLITHSQSGHIAENLANKNLVGGENTTLNPAIIGSHNKSVKVVKSILDPVSALTETTKNDIKIIPKTLNPIDEHSTNILDKAKKNIFGFGLDHGQNIQSILFKRPEWTLTKAKAWLKKHKYKTDVDEKPNHYRFRQFEPYLFKKYITKPLITKTLNGDKNENIEFIIGIKGNSDNKEMRGKQHDIDSENHTEASSSEEEEEHEMKGCALHEQDIIDRMAKLSHDIHVHHQKHGVRPSIIKGFKILGLGIMHSAVVKPKMSGKGICGGKINRSKKFNSWFKDIGDKFKPLNKNLSPIKHQMTQSAVDNIAYSTMTPEQQMQSGIDMFGDVVDTVTGKDDPQVAQAQYIPKEETYNTMYKPVIAQPVTETAYGGYYNSNPYDFNSQPDSYARSYKQPTQISGYGIKGKSLFHDENKKEADFSRQGAVNSANFASSHQKGFKGFGVTMFKHGGNDGMNKRETAQQQDNKKFTNAEAMKTSNKALDIYNKGGFKGFGVNQDLIKRQDKVSDTEKMYALMKADRKVNGRGATGKMLKDVAANATANLINAGSSRAVNEMETRNTTGKGLKKGSPEMKEKMAKIRAMRKCNKA